MLRRDAIKLITAMLGASLSPSLLGALESSQPKTASGQFTPEQRLQISQMSERIIPTTDTPGAIAAGVPEFIERVVFQWYTDTERKIFLNGLELTNVFSRQQLGKVFVELPPEQQDVVLAQMERQGGAKPMFGGFDMLPSLEEDRSAFFPKLKELVVVGYYTSEIGATQELRHEVMPMEYKGDIPLTDVGRAWATNGFTD
jgi:hypothetical protein